MNKLPISNVQLSKADFVILGVPSDKGSRYRKGAAKAPSTIRRIVAKNEVGSVTRKGKKSLFEPWLEKFTAKAYDYGDVNLDNVEKTIAKISKTAIPITIGGDHSITYKVLSGISKEKISLIYLDAHPDFICSKRNYFGSVICDIADLKYVDLKSSVIVGVRAPEDEEIDNIKKSGIKTISAEEVEKLGIKNTINKIKKIVKKNVYLSIDLDVTDPAFAPGVTDPVPGGLTSNQLIYMVDELAKKANVGIDIMEVCPPYDIQDMTSYLAYRLILTAISSKNEGKA